MERWVPARPAARDKLARQHELYQKLRLRRAVKIFPSHIAGVFPHAKHEVRNLQNGYFTLFLKTGEPIFYLLAVNGNFRAGAEENAAHCPPLLSFPKKEEP